MAVKKIAKPPISPTPAAPVNDSTLRRVLSKLALRTTARLYHSRGLCSRITPDKIVKRGPFVDLTEAVTMRYIAEKTSIPVPKVYCAFVSGQCAYIVMKRLQGEPITEALRKMDEPGQKRLLAQLRGYLDELRALPPPSGTAVQSCVAGSLFDSRIARPIPRFGPFKTIQEFHSWLRKGLQMSQMQDGEHRAEAEKLMTRQDANWPPPVFTHGDLNPSNILVHNGQISGIIDGILWLVSELLGVHIGLVWQSIHSHAVVRLP